MTVTAMIAEHNIALAQRSGNRYPNHLLPDASVNRAKQLPSGNS